LDSNLEDTHTHTHIYIYIRAVDYMYNICSSKLHVKLRYKKQTKLFLIIRALGWKKYYIHIYIYISGLIGAASHPDKQKITIIGLLIENKLHLESEVGKNLYKWLFYGTYLFKYR